MELFRFDPPELTDADVSRVADELYGVAGDTLRLSVRGGAATLVFQRAR